MAGMQKTISLPDSLVREADGLARRLGISRTRVLQRALRLLREQRDSTDVTAALNRVHGRRGSDHGLDAILKRMQAVSLPREDW
jgi:Arc/MetJ-type ribon-helix-helix transcriptional regulator